MDLFFTPVNGKRAFLKNWTNLKLSKNQALHYPPEHPNPSITGIGLVHSLSNTVAFDFDNWSWCVKTFNDIDIDIKEVIADHFEIVSPKKNTRKIIFQAPKQQLLDYINMSGKLELRSGDRYDVYEGSAYPGGGQYTHKGATTILPMPLVLMDFWVSCMEYKAKEVKSGSGWVSPIYNGKLSVIHAFNMANPLEDVLADCGYRQKGNKWQAPTSTSGAYGVNLQASYLNPWLMCYSHHASDGVLAQRPLDAFEIAAHHHSPNLALSKAKAVFGAVQASVIKAVDLDTGEILDKTINEVNNPVVHEEDVTFNTADDCTYTHHQYPPGVIGELAVEIEDMMAFPNKEIAIISARHAIVALSGRKPSIDGIRIATVDYLFADQGVGKATVSTSLSKIISQLIENKPLSDSNYRIQKFNGISGAYGVKAFHTAFLNSPSCSVIIPEAGVASRSKAGDIDSLKAYVLENAVKNAYQAYSVKEFAESLPTVYAPGLAYLEESVMISAKDLLTPQYIQGGEMARRNFIFASHRTRVNRNKRQDFSDELINKIIKILHSAIEHEDYQTVIKLGKGNFTGPSLIPVQLHAKYYFKYTEEAQEIQYTRLEKEVEARNKSTQGGNTNPIKWSLAVRRGAKITQEALLYANCEAVLCGGERVIKVEHLKAAEAFINECDKVLLANAGIFDRNSGSELLETFVESLLNYEFKLKNKTDLQKNRVFKASEVFNGKSKCSRLVTTATVESNLSSRKIKEDMFLEGQDLGLWIYSPAGKIDDIRRENKMSSAGQCISLKVSPYKTAS